MLLWDTNAGKNLSGGSGIIDGRQFRHAELRA